MCTICHNNIRGITHSIPSFAHKAIKAIISDSSYHITYPCKYSMSLCKQCLSSKSSANSTSSASNSGDDFQKKILDRRNLLKIPFLFFSRLFFFLMTESMFQQWKIFEGVSFIAKYFSHCAQVFPLKGKVSCDANPLLFLIKVLAKPILRLNHLDRPPALSRKFRFQIYISLNPNFVVVVLSLCRFALSCHQLFPKARDPSMDG